VKRGAWLALLLALACSGGEKSRRSEQPSTAPRAAAGPALPSDAVLPPLGEVEVSFGGAEGIVARANQAPRRRVLEELARETGLVIVVFVEGGDPDGRVTLSSAGEPIEVVLARALTGVPFSITPLTEESRARLTLVVGKARDAGASRAEERAHARAGLDPSERADRVQHIDQMENEALAKLESSDPRDRVEGVEWADIATVSGYEAVIERLANDPDGEVRAAAAESLSGADVGAVRPLVAALSDPDTRVVLAALESLELLGDASVVPELAPALEHSDPAVRERAKEAADFMK
jgi:hypothetical protein